MNGIITYWVIGCVLVGMATAKLDKICPNDKPLTLEQMVAGVAIWPIAFGVALIKGPSAVVCESEKGKI